MILNRKGFTLVEVMVVVSLLAIVMISVQGILKFGIVDSGHYANYYSDKVEARYAMNKIVHEVKTNIGASFDTNKKQIIASDAATILVNADSLSLDKGEIYYYFDPDRFGTGDGYGELRNQNGDVIARDIKDFKIETDDTVDPTHKLLKVTIKSGKQNGGQFFQFSTYVQLY